MIIFQLSRKNRRAHAQSPDENIAVKDIPAQYLRKKPPLLPEVSELQVVRYYTKLSQKNYSIDTQFYPLGSCTMKYNPRGAHRLASLPGFLSRHPLSLEKFSQGYLRCAYELQEILKAVTGMQGISLTPMAGAQGEFAGVAMIRAYHESRGDKLRTEILVPDAAHGTNPASATMCGYKVREIPTNAEGDIDIEALKKVLGPQTAGIMLTNPSTLGVFERKIQEIAKLVHTAGGLLYYDGANLNAILGKVRPGDMGFDVMHLNLHKTFATPHGGGGPGGGPVAVNEKLLPFLPMPVVGRIPLNPPLEKGEIIPKGDTKEIPFFSKGGLGRISYQWLTEKDFPKSIGRLGTFMGNAGVILRAYIYARMLGREGMQRVSEFATLNANYLQKCLQKAGFTLAYPKRRASHEFLITLSKEKKNYGVTALDFAKRLLDYDFYAPTIYFPLLVPECMLIEPTETECKEQIDAFINAMALVLQEAKTEPEKLRQAPYKLAVHRIDEVKAARELDLVWREKSEQ